FGLGEIVDVGGTVACEGVTCVKGGANMLNSSSSLTMLCVIENDFVLMLVSEIGDRTLTGTDVQHRSSNRNYVVDLARMNDANERVAHDDRVDISGGKHACQLAHRLIRQTANVLELMMVREASHRLLFTTTTDEVENKPVVIPQLGRGFEQGRQRMT